MNLILEFIELINVYWLKYMLGRYYKFYFVLKECKILKIDIKNEKNKIYLVWLS